MTGLSPSLSAPSPSSHPGDREELPATAEQLRAPADLSPPGFAVPSGLWLLAFGLATTLSALAASQTYLSMLDHGHAWWRLFLWQWLYWSFWAALTPWALRRGAQLLTGGPRRGAWLITSAVAAVALAGLHLLFGALLTLSIQPYSPVAIYDTGEALRRGLTWVFIDLLVFAMLVATGYALAAYLHARRLELRESRLESELARAQLDALRLEIQPHFLFNTLNSIAALVRRGSGEAAVEMIVGLSDLLRATVERRDRQWVTLRDELDFIQRYVDLQRARFADRLRVSFEIDDELLEMPVPFLLLQPLVENSIRHGVARRTTATEVEIRVQRRGGAVEISVSDDGPGLPQGFSVSECPGLGLHNVRSRLSQLYGPASSLELGPRAGGGVRCAVTLPPPSAPDPAARGLATEPTSLGAVR